VTPRIVSLLPSATEIVCALGLEHALVGRSHECDFPPGVERLPVCTAPKAGGDGTRAIHENITAILQHDISVYSVDAGRLRDLRPTHIVTQIQCEVCAVSLRDVEAALASWSGSRPQIVALNPQSLDDVFGDIRRTADSVGAAAAGESVIHSMMQRLDSIAAVTRDLPEKPRVATIEWMEPLMAAGNWMPALIELAGGINLLGEANGHSPWITWKQLAEADPDVITVFPCGFRIGETIRDWGLLESHAEWRTLRAVREDRIFVLDGNQYFNRPGPRLAQSAEILAEIFHPQAFDFGHRGTAWRHIGH
jgi:iron complex transport system substrate-binding protein